MSTLTKEWLLKTIAELEEERDAVPGIVNEDAAMALAAMKRVLASLEAEPVAEVCEGFTLRYIGHGPAPKSGVRIGDRLYTAPPAPVSVLDEKQSRELFENWCSVSIERNKWHPEHYAHLPAREQWAAWEACRAAMLQGAVGNSPVIQDGWVAVPKEPTPDMREAYHQAQAEYEDVDGLWSPDHQWKAMLAAAPHFREIVNSSTNNCREKAEMSTKCWCHTCRQVTFADSRFVVCPVCGNKRCPHANDHRNACTGSNEPGQEGSAYPAAPMQEVK